METTRPSLLIRLRDHHDTDAWKEFDGIYRPFMQRYARARGLDTVAADEVVQDCLAAVANHIRGFEYDPAKGRFKSWLRTLVNNRIRNRLRDRRARQPATGELDTYSRGEDAPEEVFDTIWRQEHLRHCLAGVRTEVEPKTYDAFVMHAVQGASTETVCDRFSITANHLRVIKARMTRRLQQRMRELLGEEAA